MNHVDNEGSSALHQAVQNGQAKASSSYTTVCLPVQRDNTQASASGLSPVQAGAPVAQWFSGPGFEAHSRGNLLNRKRDSVAHSLSFLFTHHHNITEILLKRM